LPRLLTETTPGFYASSILCLNDTNRHHKHQAFDPLIRSVSTVTTVLSNVSSVFQLFFFLAVCSDMIMIAIWEENTVHFLATQLLMSGLL